MQRTWPTDLGMLLDQQDLNTVIGGDTRGGRPHRATAADIITEHGSMVRPEQRREQVDRL